MNRVYKFFGGTSRFFAFWFFFVGAALAFMGKLTMNYAVLATGVQTLIVLHSAKEDYVAKNLPQTTLEKVG